MLRQALGILRLGWTSLAAIVILLIVSCGNLRAQESPRKLGVMQEGATQPAVPTAPSTGQGAQGVPHQRGLVQDWSMRHVLFPRVGPSPAMLAAQRDPRAMLSWRAATSAATRTSSALTLEPQSEEEEFPATDESSTVQRGHVGHPRKHRNASHGLHIDWSIPLAGGTTAPGMFPAKFGFDVNAVPSCANDFVIFPVNQPPSITTPNLVGFRDLYSGTVPANGICNRTPVAGVDDGVSATVLWSYAVSTPGLVAGVSTSPVLSLDGTKVAFVESAGGSQPHFHVLAWKSGDGVNLANLQDASAPMVISAFSSTAPTAGSGAATDLAFGDFSAGAGDTLSSPFIVYGSDLAYVGDDQGNLVRIKDVFCTVNPACLSATPPAPSIDASWGTAGTVTVGPGSCAGTGLSLLTGPVVDVVSGNVYVGCADGLLYGFDSSGAALAIPSVIVGDGSPTGGIVDPPIVDGINGFVYAVSGSNGTDAILVQTKTDLSLPRTATVGAPGIFSLHTPEFTDTYFSSPTSTSWLVYVLAYDGTGTDSVLYGATFDASRNLTIGTPANALVVVPGFTAEYSPPTEFLNGGTDRLFASILSPSPPPNVASFNINSFPAGVDSTASEGSGTSGIIVDNVSTQNQASSIYFATQGTNSAVKLTQSGLQ